MFKLIEKEIVMREQRQDEDRVEYDGACLAYDITTEVRARWRV